MKKAAKAGVGENCRAGPSPWDFVVPVAYSQVPNSLWESNMTMESHRIAYDSRQIGCSSSRFRKMCLEIWREVLGQTRVGQTQPTRTGWWFGTMEFYDFPYIGNNTPIWLFFRGVETTNQRMCFFFGVLVLAWNFITLHLWPRDFGVMWRSALHDSAKRSAVPCAKFLLARLVPCKRFFSDSDMALCTLLALLPLASAGGGPEDSGNVWCPTFRQAITMLGYLRMHDT